MAGKKKVEDQGRSLWTATVVSGAGGLPNAKIPGLEDEIAKMEITPCPDEETRAFRTLVSAETLARAIEG